MPYNEQIRGKKGVNIKICKVFCYFYQTTVHFGPFYELKHVFVRRYLKQPSDHRSETWNLLRRAMRTRWRTPFVLRTLVEVTQNFKVDHQKSLISRFKTFSWFTIENTFNWRSRNNCGQNCMCLIFQPLWQVSRLLQAIYRLSKLFIFFQNEGFLAAIFLTRIIYIYNYERRYYLNIFFPKEFAVKVFFGGSL